MTQKILYSRKEKSSCHALAKHLSELTILTGVQPEKPAINHSRGRKEYAAMDLYIAAFLTAA